MTQYQLWIFDGTRDDRFPFDGGVSDVLAGVDEVIVPIFAKIPARHAVWFAVTVEDPSGVVVSTRERLLLASVAEPSGWSRPASAHRFSRPCLGTAAG